MECNIYNVSVSYTVYLPAIDQSTRSKPKYAKLVLLDKEGEMFEFLVHFLHPFDKTTTAIQQTATPSLHKTWVRYETMFDVLDEAKKCFQSINLKPEWLTKV